MLKAKPIFGLAFVALIAGASQAAAQQGAAHGDPKLLTKARIQPDAAKAIALKAQAGTIKDWELEVESGGSGLRYSFDVEANDKVHEVGVDAADGKVLENIVDTAEAETKEADEES